MYCKETMEIALIQPNNTSIHEQPLELTMDRYVGKRTTVIVLIRLMLLESLATNKLET
jgi:hypothetical protein